ncbi:MAG: hypothetical protein JW818_09500 [Pirellulales bacterium]|nr:hypothetical protein [Pirellulales bacterium]
MSPDSPTPSRPPIQYGIGTLLIATTALAVLLGTLQWMGLAPEVIALVFGVLLVGALAGVALVVALLRGIDNRRQDGENDES